MPLVECKECKNNVSTNAPTCPHCGVPDPAVSYEEERLIREIEQNKEAIEFEKKRYESQLGGGLFDQLFEKLINRLLGQKRTIVEECRMRYEGAVAEGKELEAKLEKLRNERYKSDC